MDVLSRRDLNGTADQILGVQRKKRVEGRRVEIEKKVTETRTGRPKVK